MSRFRVRLAKAEPDAAVAEYGLIAILIALAIMVSVGTVNETLGKKFGEIVSELAMR